MFFVRSFDIFRHIGRTTSKFLVKVSLSEYIFLTTHQKAFIFEPWVPEKVIFYAMSFGPRVHAPGLGLKVKIYDTVKMCFFKCVLEQSKTESLSDIAQP